MEIRTEDAFYIASWLIEPAINRISREGEVRQLDPRTMQVLICLAENPGDVVKREYLMDNVWKEVIVNENTLSSVIARLRKLLDDDWQNPQYVETISKAGYRLIAPVLPARTRTRYHEGDHLPVMTVSLSEAVEPGHPIEQKQRTASWSYLGAFGLTSVLILLAIVWWPSLFDTPQVPLDPQPLLTLPGTEVGATVSPDGQHVAFMWQGENQDNWDVYLTLIGEDHPVRLTTSPDPEGLPTWSPDGQHIAFVRGNQAAETCSIFRIPLIGGQALRLGACEQGVTSMFWSNNGKYITMNALDSLQSSTVIKVLDIDQQELRTLTTPPAGSRGDKDPVFSPDDEQIAFRRRRVSGNYDLFVVPAKGGAARQLTYDKQSTVSGVDWTPDGNHLLYSSNRDGEYRLWRMPVSGGEPTRENLNDEGLTWLRHARESNRLVYRTMRDETDLWLVSMDKERNVTSNPNRQFSSTREELFPQYSPTGERIAFTSKRTGFYEIWTAQTDGSGLIRHTDFRSPLVGPPRWSPDGQQLVFDASPEGHADLYLVRVDSKIPTRLTSDLSNESNARFSRNGQSIYFSSNRSGQREIWKTTVSGQETIQITQNTGVDAQESPDGQHLYYTRADTIGLWKMPVQGGASVQVLDKVSPWDWGNWVVVEDGIYFVEQGSRAIAFYPFDTGVTTQLYTPEKMISFIGPALTVSADETSILFGQIERSEDEIMLVDL